MKLFNVLGTKAPMWQAPETPTGEATPPTDTIPTDPPATDASLVSGTQPATEDTAAADDTSTADEITPLAASDVAVPEGFEMAEEAMTSFLGIMNNAELTHADRASQLIALQAQNTTELQEAAQTANKTLWDETQTSWRADAQKLPEIGGANLDGTLATIKKGLESVGGDQSTFNALDLTGAGNHPAIIKILHALTAPLMEAGHIDGAPSKDPLNQADKMFGAKKD